MTETKRSEERRKAEGFFFRYIHGEGIDIGCGNYKVADSAVGYDRKHTEVTDIKGDASDMRIFPDGSFDYVYSSHCLEHIDDVKAAVKEWWRILKPSGYLIVAVPHRDYYERKLMLPSIGNARGHKHFFLPFVADPPGTLALYPLLMSLSGAMLVRLNDFPNETTVEAIVQKGEYTPQVSHRWPWRGDGRASL